MEDRTEPQSTPSLQLQAGCPERYKILSVIGQGAMGVVFLAQDNELGRDVAIKVLSTQSANDESKQRFLREVKTLAGLTHTNIVKIYSSGMSSHGSPFHVMEFLDGTSLSKELEKGALGQEQFFDLFNQVLLALEFAHQQKIIHRDLKPSNIMLCKDDDGKDLYKVIDFGIARMDNEEAVDAQGLTRTGVLLGSPAYMSPEQCRGERIDHRSDIYSIGCIMYECITGKQLFSGETALEVMYKHMTAEAPKLVSPKLSKKSNELAALIDKCLQKSADSRPQSISYLLGELVRISKGKVNLNLFDRKTENRTKFNSTALAFAVIACGLMILGAFYFLPKPKPEQVLKLSNKESYLERSLMNFQARVDKWKDSDPAKRSQNQNLACLKDMFDLGRTQMHFKKKYVDAENTYRQAIVVAESLNGLDGINRTASAQALLAKCYWLQVRYEESEKEFETALKTIKAPGGSLDIYFDILMERTSLLITTRKFVQARTNFAEIKNYLQPAFRDSFGEQIKGIDQMDQSLDQYGESRFAMAKNSFNELYKLKPTSSSEAIAMVRLSNLFLELFRNNDMKAESQKAWDYSCSILSAIEGEEALKAGTIHKRH